MLCTLELMSRQINQITNMVDKLPHKRKFLIFIVEFSHSCTREMMKLPFFSLILTKLQFQQLSAEIEALFVYDKHVLGKVRFLFAVKRCSFVLRDFEFSS